MKKMMFTLIALLTMSAAANAMSYEQARNEALFLTDKMAYELNLTDAQYEAAYEINLDYLMGVTSVDDVYGIYWERRNLDLSYILYQWQWDAYLAANYFYRPLYWSAGRWHFGIYARYTVRDYFYFGHPRFYVSYRGGHAWHMNGGRSYYHGRADHFRPALRDNHQHYGMRSRFDNGEFRNRSGRFNDNRSYRSGSSTRVTAGRDRSNMDRGRSNMDRERSNMNRERSGFGRSNNENRSIGSTTAPTNRNFGSSNSTASRNLGGSNSTPSRNFGGSNSTPSRSIGSTTTAPTRSFGGSRSSSTSSRSSSAPSRSSSSSSSRSSSNSHGHFGGRR